MKTFIASNKDYLKALGFIIIACLSFFMIANSDAITHITERSVAALDEKKMTVVGLATTSSAASMAITAIPGDVGGPVAENLADISDYLIIVLGSIWLQKYLVGITAFVTFKVIIPLVSLIMAINIFAKREDFTAIAKKLFLFGLIFFALIPTSVAVSNHIEATYKDSAALAVEKAEKNSTTSSKSNDNQGLISGLFSKVKSSTKKALEKFKTSLSNMIDAVAVLIITTCVIPILVVIFFLWLTKLIFALDIDITLPKINFMRRANQKLKKQVK